MIHQLIIIIHTCTPKINSPGVAFSLQSVALAIQIHLKMTYIKQYRHVFRRILRCARKIDNSPLNIGLQSALCGAPTVLYSYKQKSNVFVGDEMYPVFNQFLQARNHGEFSKSLDKKTDNVTLSYLIRDATLGYIQEQQNKESDQTDQDHQSMLLHLNGFAKLNQH